MGGQISSTTWRRVGHRQQAGNSPFPQHSLWVFRTGTVRPRQTHTDLFLHAGPSLRPEEVTPDALSGHSTEPTPTAVIGGKPIVAAPFGRLDENGP